MRKNVNELVRDYLHHFADDDASASIEEFNRLSGKGHSRGWRLNCEEIYERRQREARNFYSPRA